MINKLSLILKKNKSISIPGIYDPLTAKLAELHGFQAAWVSGFCVSTSLFIPDENYMQINQYATRIADIKKASSIPLIVDCDEGYGNLDNTFELFEKLVNIGVEACCIEDNVFPKMNSFKLKPLRHGLLQVKEVFAEKLYLLRKKFPHLFLIARTESLIVGESIEKAIERAKLYKESGADLLVIHSRSKTVEDFSIIAREWGFPQDLVVIPTMGQDVCYEDLSLLGYKVIIFANQLLRNAICNMNILFNKMRCDTSITELNTNSVSMEYIFNLIDGHYKNIQNV